MKRIVVGLDGSPRAKPVLDSAVKLATAFGGKLTVLRAVMQPLELPPEAYTVSPVQLVEMLREQAQKELEALTSSGPKELFETVEARIGTPWQVVCDGAREVQADVVVIGTHGYGVLDRLIGTTAARVVNHAKCSVFVVRNGAIE